MRVGLVVLLGLAALGGVLWLLLDEPGSVDTAEGIERTGETGAAPTAGPRLVGAADETSAPYASTAGRFAAHGRVVDAAGAPLAGIAVEVRTRGSWGGNRSYHDTARYFVDALRTAVARLKQEGGPPPPAAVLTTDEAGRFTYLTDTPGEVTFRARVAPPRTSTSASTILFERAFLSSPLVRVLDGTPLQGRVVDAQERPVAARVEASWRGADRARWSEEQIADAASGRFAFGAVPTGTTGFDVTVGGRAYARLAQVETPTDEEVVLRLPDGVASLEGLVHTADGTPVAGALLRLRIELPGGEAGNPDKRPATADVAATSDGEGHVALAGLPHGEVTSITAVADGYRRVELRRNATWPGLALRAEAPATLDLTLHRGATLRGRVLTHPEGEPLPGATVTLYFLGWHPPQEEVATTDGEGRYRFDGLGAGRFLLLPSHPTHYCPELATATAGNPYAAQDRQPPAALALQIADEDGALERDLRLARGGSIAGRVEDANGRTVAGAAIYARQHGLAAASFAWGMSPPSVDDIRPLGTSGDDGAFRIDGLPPRADWVLYAKKRGTSGQHTEPIAVRPNETTEGVVVALAEQCIVRGRVLDEAGEPMADLSVFVNGPIELFGGPYLATTDETGAFEADSLPPAPLTLSASRADQQRVEARVEGLAPGEVREGVELRFGLGHEIAGVVVDTAGEPVSSIPIFARSLDDGGSQMQTHTGRDGTFRLPNVTARRVQLSTLSGRTWTSLGDPVEPPVSDLRLVFDRPAISQVTVRILGPDGKPVPSARVQARSNDDKSSEARTVTDGAGTIDVMGQPPFSVWATHPTDREGRPMNVRGGFARVLDPAQPALLQFEVGREIAGVIVDEDDKPVPGVTIRCDPQATTSDLDGRWHLVGLEPGNVAVRIEPPGPFVAPANRVVPEGEQELRIVLAKGLAIAGRVVVPEGVSMPGGAVDATWAATPDHTAGHARTQIQPTGAFRLLGIPPGVLVEITARVWSTGPRGTNLAPAVVADVAPGTEDLEIRLGAGVVLSGRVVDARGDPVRKGQVSVQGMGTSGWAELEGEGRFRVGGLRPGRYRAYVRIDDGPFIQPHEVEAPATDVLLQLPATAAITGTLSGLNGETGWVVRAVDATTGNPFPTHQSAKVAPDGRWTLPDVPKGTAWVVIAARSPADGRYARSAPVAAGESDVALAIANGGRIEGRAEIGGRSVARASVTAMAPGWYSSVTSDDLGSFTLSGLPPGTYTVKATAWQARRRGQQSNVPTGTANLVIDLDEDM